MKDSIFFNGELKTPAYVYDQGGMLKVLSSINELKNKSGCCPLYSIKSANSTGLLHFLRPYVSGFSCSSLFELRLASEVLEQPQSMHITTPAYRDEEMDSICAIAEFVTLNSVSQWQRLGQRINLQASCGLRINPELSFVTDERYDPCRPDSKLGITAAQLAEAKKQNTLNWEVIDGIHVHNNCESVSLAELKQSVDKVLYLLSEYRPNLKWFNLGGGYLFDADIDYQPLYDAISAIKKEYSADIYLEPGKAITGQAGYLVASVIDLIEHDNSTIAVLDSSINHLPEVFEYQYQPQLINSSESGNYLYRLAGSTCLSGDLFGDYHFDSQLRLGSRVVFKNAGAYMQVKANMFNGINLPDTYLLNTDNELELIKSHNYANFRERL